MWMSEKEAIITKANKDKAELIKVCVSCSLCISLEFNLCNQENRNLRRALNPITHQTYIEMKRTEDQLDSCRADLEEACFEIRRLKVGQTCDTCDALRSSLESAGGGEAEGILGLGVCGFLCVGPWWFR